MSRFLADLYALDNPPHYGGAPDSTHPSGPFPTRDEAAKAAAEWLADNAASMARGTISSPFAWFTVREVSDPDAEGEGGGPGGDPPRFSTMAGEFGDFDQGTLPPDLPPSWSDVSWHNDACPAFETPEGVHVFCDYPEPDRRETADGRRYSAYAMYGEPGDWQAGCDESVIPGVSSDDFADVLAYVAKVPTMRKAAQAVEAFEALHTAISGLLELYGETGDNGFNEIQPDAHVSAVCPLSFDEWACEAGALVEAWRAIARGEEPEPTTSPSVGVER